MYLGIFSFHSSASPTSTTPLGKYNKPLSSLSIAQESEKLSLSSAFSGHSSKDCWNVRSFLCSVTPRFEFDTNWMICMVKYSFLYIPIKGQPTLFIYLFIYLTRVTLNSRVTDKPVALEFHVELEFRNVSFWGGRKTGEPGEKPSEQGRELTTNSTHIWRRSPGIEPGPPWWEASALTTAPSLLPQPLINE